MSKEDSLIAEALEMLDTEEMYGLPPALQEGLRRYLANRISTGSFLRACLENDFAEAMGRAHPALYAHQYKLIAQLLNNGFPAIAWGSPEKVTAWLAKEEGDECQAK